MRTHTYWKTYEEYLKWSFNSPKQINYVTKDARGINHCKNGVRASRVHIKFIYGGLSPVSPLYGENPLLRGSCKVRSPCILHPD